MPKSVLPSHANVVYEPLDLYRLPLQETITFLATEEDKAELHSLLIPFYSLI